MITNGMLESEKVVLEQAIKLFGVTAQTSMCIEECSELITALLHHRRMRVGVHAVLEELADVSIMVDQLSLIYGREHFLKVRDEKIIRLQQRILGAR